LLSCEQQLFASWHDAQPLQSPGNAWFHKQSVELGSGHNYTWKQYPVHGGRRYHSHPGFNPGFFLPNGKQHESRNNHSERQYGDTHTWNSDTEPRHCDAESGNGYSEYESEQPRHSIHSGYGNYTTCNAAERNAAQSGFNQPRWHEAAQFDSASSVSGLARKN
jgi:hypothetical protein